MTTRVLHVVEASLGGVRRYLEDIALASVDRSWASGLVYADTRADAQFGDLLATCEKSGWQLFRVPMCRAVRPHRDLVSLARLRSVFDEFRPDVLHCHSAKAGALGRVAARLTRPRPALSVYSPHASAANLGGRYALVERALSRRVTDVVVAVSESERLQLLEAGLGGPVVDVVWPVVDVHDFRPLSQPEARAAVGITPAEPVLLGVGRLSAQKNPLAFVRALALVREQVPDVFGVWVGDGELRSTVMTAAEQLGLADRFRITGWVTDVRPYLAAADVVFNTSNYESFGYATAEALAMERPVVATRVPGTVDIVQDGEWGALFDVADLPSAAAAAVADFLRSPERRQAAGIRGRRFVAETFRQERMADDLERVYARAPGLAGDALDAGRR
jgi:glycosyltransferase involved in cell wall biosynthesis